jgi:hypothetical protein
MILGIVRESIGGAINNFGVAAKIKQRPFPFFLVLMRVVSPLLIIFLGALQ